MDMQSLSEVMLIRVNSSVCLFQIFRRNPLQIALNPKKKEAQITYYQIVKNH